MCISEKTCPAPDDVPNASVESGQKSEYVSGDTLTYKCNSGWTSAGSLARTCGSNGWSQAPVCTGKKPPLIQDFQTV